MYRYHSSKYQEENKIAEKKIENSISSIPNLQTLPSSVISYYSKYRNKFSYFKRQTIMKTTFEVDDKYEVLDVKGQGAYGIVVSARDKTALQKENSEVAIKKIEKAFEHKVFTKRTLRELKILRLLNHENVIGINTLLLPRSREEFQDIYVCTPLMETDLASIIKSPQSLTDSHAKFFLYQILRGLKYIHSAGVIHRDLKPRNLLINSNCDLRICDFGLSRIIHSAEESGKMTDYVATRWYRAPELLLETGEYGPAVDVWSVGCILAEILRRRPFLPGSDTKNQIEITFDLVGSPDDDFLSHVALKQRVRKFFQSLPQRKPKDFSLLFPKSNPLAVDLLEKMLIFDPKKRISVEEALNHPYLKELSSPDDEPTRDLLPSTEFEFEKSSLSLQQLKDLVYEEILLYHYPDFKAEYLKKIQQGINPFIHVIYNDNAVGFDRKV